MPIRKDGCEPCRSGCGKPVNNRAGLCFDCRKVKCKRCGKEFALKTLGTKQCYHCKFSLAKTARGSAAI